MVKKMKKYPVPKFSNVQEEDEYWKTHSPLDEGYEGEIQENKQKRSSFLSVRLTGEELSKLRGIAVEAGMSPSTFARKLILDAIKARALDNLYSATVVGVHDRSTQQYDKKYHKIREKAHDALDKAFHELHQQI